MQVAAFWLDKCILTSTETDIESTAHIRLISKQDEDVMKKIATLIVGVALSLSLVSSTAALVTYSGSMSSSDGGVQTDGFYAVRSFDITWRISETDDGWWRYEYWMPALRPNVLPGIEWDAPDGTFGISVNSQAYQGLFRGTQDNPLTIGSYGGSSDQFQLNHALLFDVTNSYFSFESKYVPAWGDFFASYGTYYNTTTQQTEDNRAWNTGMASGDPGGPPANGNYMNKILRPDTSSAIPEPGTMLLFGLGLAGAGIYRRVRRQQ